MIDCFLTHDLKGKMSARPSLNPFEDIPRPKPEVPTVTPKSLSRIPNMTVGDVRHCFSQMRSTVYLSTKTVLLCGLTAGEFALHYLASSSGVSRKKRLTTPP